MDPTRMTVTQWILVGGAFGLVIGLVPLVTGFIKKNLKYGFFGFVGSLIGGALLGLLLAIPVAAIFTWLILRRPKAPSEVVIVNQDPIDVSMKEGSD